MIDDAYGGGWLRRIRRSLMSPFRKMWTYRNLDYCRKRADAILALIESSIPSDVVIRHLDVGCNKGFLLEASLRKRWEPWGIEIASDVITPFMNTYPEVAPRVFCGPFPEVATGIVDETFDLITAIDVIEHFYSVVDGLSVLFRLLKPGGILLVRTPNTNSVAARRDVERWGALKEVEHLSLLNEDLLQSIGKNVGFRQVTFLEEVVEEPESNMMAFLLK